MKRNQYSNGMYKGTSKLQDLVETGIFTSLYEIYPNSLTMGMNFDQWTGECLYDFEFNGQTLKVKINQDGKVVGKFYAKG